MDKEKGLIWNALSELETNFAELGGSRKYQGFRHIDKPYYICGYLLKKMYFYDQPRIENHHEFLNRSKQVIDKVHSYLDRINLNDLQLINLINQFINYINSKIRTEDKIFYWKELELFVQNLMTIDLEKDAIVIVSAIIHGDFENSRVCLNPQKWDEFYEIIKTKINFSPDEKFPAPLILAAWHFTSDKEKFERFHEQLRIVADKGYIRQIKVILDNYSEDDWHHFGE